MDVEFNEHTFMPSHTIHAVLKYHNNYNLSQEELLILLETFCTINGKHDESVKVGETLKIPVMFK